MENQNQVLNSKLIINADDLGWSEHRDRGILELLEGGFISSATAMVNGYNSVNSIKIARKKNYKIGLHLNLTEGQLVDRENEQNNSLVSKRDFILDESSDVQQLYVMHDKFPFREKIEDNMIKQEDVEREIRAQIKLFIKLYGTFPSHIDGHMHIHTIPFIANILAPIMSKEFSIYKTRLPIEELDYLQNNNFAEKQQKFYETIVQQSKQAKIIFQNYGVYSTSSFLGMLFMSQNCQVGRFQHYIQQLQNQYPDRMDSIEIMCHPGYSSINFGCEFNKSQDRVHELNIYKSEEFQKLLKQFNINKIPFKDLTNKLNKQQKPTICLYSVLTPYTGNFISSLRIQSILNQLGYNCILRGHNAFNRDDNDSMEREIIEFQNFIKRENIQLILGVNVYRSGIILSKIQENDHLKIGYIISGTDANEAVKSNEKLIIIQQSLCNSSILVSMNQQMLNIFNQHFKSAISNKNIQTMFIPQSYIQENVTQGNIPQNDQINIRQVLNLPNNTNIILLTAGIRPVKDVSYVLQQIKQVLLDQQDYIYVHVGPILNQNSYDQYQQQLQDIFQEQPSLQNRIFYKGTLSYEIYQQLLKESKIFINTSISEGMCTAIVEAMSQNKVVICRGNEGNIELIKHKKTGLIFKDQQDFKEQLINIIKDESIYKQLSQNAYEDFVQNFSYEKEKQGYQQILNNLFN